MSPATVWLLRQIIRNLRAILTACEEWLKRTNGEESQELK